MGPDGTRRSVPTWLVVPAGIAVVAAVWALVAAFREPVTVPPAGQKPMKVFRFVEPEAVVHRSRFRFTYDSPAVLAELRESEGLESVIAGATSDLERFRRLNAWTRAQFEPGVPDPYPPLDARIVLRDIRSGFTGGFCAQYNYVLAQGLMSLGYHARYVTVHRHEVIEAWLPDEGRWVCLDPLYAATYVDESGKALSALELVRRGRGGRPVIPGPGSLPGTAEKVAGSFSRLAVWIRNDHISKPINFTDIDRYKVHFLWPDSPPPPSGALATDLPQDLYFAPGPSSVPARERMAAGSPAL